MTTQAQRHRVPTKPTPAASAVRERLRELSRELRRTIRAKPLSAKKLHNLRVACRRAEAALRLCREVAESRAWRWLHERLRELRRSCNPARDDDVLRSWLKQNAADSSDEWRRDLKSHRQAAVPAIVKRAKRLAHDQRFQRQAAKIVNRLRALESKNRAALVFGRSLFDEVHRFVRSFPSGSDDAAAWHALRINGKRLRYASEIVSQIWPDVELSELREQLQTLQQQLGTVHDLQVGCQRLESWNRNGSPRAARELFATMSDSLSKAEQAFEMWWKSCPLERTLADTTAEVLTLIRK